MRNGGNFSYFALLYTNTSYDPHSLLENITELYDLDNNLLATDTIITRFLTTTTISRRAMPRAVGLKVDVGQKFWVGAVQGVEFCIENNSWARSMQSDIFYTIPCNSSLPLMCVAIPTALPPRQELCNQTLVQQGLQVDCLTVTLPPSFDNNL